MDADPIAFTVDEQADMADALAEVCFRHGHLWRDCLAKAREGEVTG